MQIRVRYFAIFREATGIEAEQVNTSAVNPKDLFVELVTRHPGMQHEAAALVAINDEMADWQTPINDGDEVLFFPPVAGG